MKMTSSVLSAAEIGGFLLQLATYLLASKQSYQPYD
jgi:hypothetical protein